MKKKILIGLSLSIVLIVALVGYKYLTPERQNEFTAQAKKGLFEVIVTSTGELRSKNSTKITGPYGARNADIYKMKISKLIDEGSVVKTGDFVAELDKSEIVGKIKSIELSLQKLKSQYLQAKLDSTLTLSGARDNLENLRYGMEEAELKLKQSKYEPPATIRQAEITHEKSKRSYRQAVKNYSTKVKQSVTKISIVSADMQKEQQKIDHIIKISNEFTILAPADGMLIYAKEWGGRKIVVGSQISVWNPTVATLPDLSNMESITYINEIDIQKIKMKQKVKMGLDAAPDKEIFGEIISVANIGEERRDTKSKVFEVVIKVSTKDSTLLPSMTTSNNIKIASLEDVVFVPLETIYTFESDSEKYHYVFKKDNGSYVRQEVLLGIMNDNQVVIKEGLSDKDVLLLSEPEDPEAFDFTRLGSNNDEH